MASSRLGLFALSAFSAVVLTGCVSYESPFKPPMGLISAVKAPLQVNADQGGVVVATSFGEASSFYFHDPIFTGLDFAWDDCSTQTAARNAGLSGVNYADYDVFQVLGIFGRMTVRAYGPTAPVQR